MVRFLKNSLFPRLLLVILGTGLLLAIIFAGYHRAVFNPRSQAGINKNLRQYVSYIIDDIGIPPDTVRARAFARENALHIRYENGDMSWSSSPAMPTVGQATRHHSHRRCLAQGFCFYRGKPLMLVQRGPAVFMLGFDFRQHINMRPGYFITLTLLMAAVLTGAFLAIRRLLRPVRPLQEGVLQLTRGNLEHRIPDCGTDELGTLATAFNTMAGRICEMLKQRDQLLLDVSHELRSPLTRVRVALEMLPDNERKTDILQDMAEIESMVREILETERLKSDHGKLARENTNLTVLVRDVINSYRGTDIQLAAPEKHVVVHIDPVRIRTVVKNVLDNALKYSPADAPKPAVTVTQETDTYCVTVADHGPGIPAVDLDAVFEPFYRVDKSRTRSTGGYGLGLALCRSIMEAHSGRITAGAVPGGGTVIRMTFPR